MPKKRLSARMRTHARQPRRYSVAYSAAPAEYRILFYDSLWQSVAVWWKLKRHPGHNNVTWNIN
jgi:hypothetical protein